MMMRATLTIMASAAAVSVTLASPCFQIGRNQKDECETLGCRYDGGNCREPTFCEQASEPYLYVHPYGDSTIDTFRVIRPPLTTEQSNLCSPANSPECSVIYEVTLTPEYTTGPPNCNDLGMLPPHGRNQEICADPTKNQLEETESKYWENNARKSKLGDYTNHPFPNDPIKQSVAAGANAHTSLMEETANCFKMDSKWLATTDDNTNKRNEDRPNGELNRQCAFPLGFASDTILKNKAVCVKVKGAEGRWVEIMAASAGGSSGGSFCASDWGAEGEEQACTKEGDLYECREAGRSQSGGSEHEMRVKFQAFDNIDDAHLGINWRIVASKLPEGSTGVPGEEKDAEDWCQFRDAADYPMSLMGAYPKNFKGNPVFDIKRSSGAGLVPAAAAVLAAVGAALAL